MLCFCGLIIVYISHTEYSLTGAYIEVSEFSGVYFGISDYNTTNLPQRPRLTNIHKNDISLGAGTTFLFLFMYLQTFK